MNDCSKPAGTRPHEINAFLFAILLVYSLVLHASAVAAFSLYLERRPECLELSGKLKIPYSPIVSLTGRKGNTYDRSKINAKIAGTPKPAFDLKDKINSTRAKIEIMFEKFKPVPQAEPEKAAIKSSQAAKAAVKNPQKRRPAVLKEKAYRAAAVSNADESAETRTAENGSSGPSGDPANAGAEKVFGNMSGNDTEGEKLAGAPHGEADAAIEASKIDIFKSVVREKIMSNVRYPERCRRFEAEGTVRLKFEITPGGGIGGIEVADSSGCEEIDEAAVEAVKAARPFTPFPDGVNKNIAFSIPLNYKLRR
ncbi:MAG TPA: TonB family protein [Candidatus Wallbacteria bacterium]|nr:MAG: transport protein TonB [bacterium ADurb.Bin243]HPG56972.1 TonB family protein [Candidatus Wallbacteria bacterium]